MKHPLSSGLKITFVLHAVFAGVIGLSYLLIPQTVGALTGWDMSDAAYRIIGAFGIALAVSSALAAVAQQWLEVRIKIALELVWILLADAVMVWALLTGQVPASAWLFVIVFAMFFVAFGYFAYASHRQAAARLQTGH